ncbi:3,8-divinyl protochlorophyllide a 8-vinyl-reductase (NADPH) [Salvia divinorum]|uniref:3,8-divinyl protochlorophyllide a 8-vinyl-reductase (NADPH) n=1 Tax=Salvia divinorum TaxID=28513 RepID=A0ABD1GWH8_SALDI
MSICTPFNCNGLNLNSFKSNSFKNVLTYQFINQFQVPTIPSSAPLPSVHLSESYKGNRKRSQLVTASAAPTPSFRSKNPKDINILVVGSTGYIGNFVVKELVRRGFNVIAVARERSGIKGKNSKDETLGLLSGANACFSDVTKKFGAAHFVLLSAICVQKPLLEFQRAELIKEAEKDEGFSYSVVRPTAFFKSLAGEVELVKDGKPYVMFGDGRLCACKPISEPDLAFFITECVLSEDLVNKVLPIGGPGKAVTPLEQGEMLFRLVGKEPKFLKVPIQRMDFAIGVLDFLVKIFPSLEDAAEFGKIGRYYAAESMLIWDPETGEYDADSTPSYDNDSLEGFFKRVLEQGMAGQELGEQTIF